MNKYSLDKGVRNWYLENYPTDDMGIEINESITFIELYSVLMAKRNFYEAVGNGIDSIIRERIFEKLSQELSVDYGVIYNMWLSAD